MSVALVFYAVVSLPHACRSTRMYPAICGLEWWVRVYLYTFALPEQGNKLSFGGRCRRKPTVLRCSDRGWTSVCQTWTHQSQQSYLVRLFVPYDDSLLVLIRQNFAQLKEIYRRHCIYIIDQNESRGTAQVEAIARKKEINFFHFYSPRTHKCDGCFRAGVQHAACVKQMNK